MVSDNRRLLLRQLFPGGVPRLWCPVLTHYRADGTIDEERIAAHLRHLSKYITGILVPGSTGDGWELTPDETSRLLETALPLARELKLDLLIGILKANGPEAVATLQNMLNRLKTFTTASDTHQALSGARVGGFTVCAPRGKG